MTTQLGWNIKQSTGTRCIGSLAIGDWFIYEHLPAVLIRHPQVGFCNMQDLPPQSKKDHEILIFGYNGTHLTLVGPFTPVEIIKTVHLDIQK